MANQRVPTTTIDSTFDNGDILYGADVNQIIDVFRAAVNENKLDLNKLLMGSDYFYIADNLEGLNALAAGDTPSIGDKGFIFDGGNTDEHLEIYEWNATSWQYISGVSLLNPYVETLKIEGKVFDINDSSDTIQVDLDSVKLQLGQQLFFRVKFTEAVSKGDAIQFAGAQGNHFLAKKTRATEMNANPEYFIGLAANNYSTNDFGLVLEFGPLLSIYNSNFAAGDILWLQTQGTTNGGLTTVDPGMDYARIRVAAVINDQNAQNGQWIVRPNILEQTGNRTYLDSEPSSSLVIEGDLWFDLSGG